MSELLGAVGGGAIGLAVGEAGATVLEPALEAPKQEAWKNSQAKILELGELASLVAQALNAVEDVLDDANRNGYDEDQLRSAIQLALKAPGPPEAEKLYLRAQGGYPGSITAAQLSHAYAKAGLEGQWWKPLSDAAANTLLSPAEIALGIIRSMIADPGFIPGGPYDVDGKVPAYTQSTLDPVKMAAAAGISEDLLRVLVGSIGLPPSVQQLASMQFRGIIEQGDYNRGIAEGDARPEWGPYWLEQARVILSPHDGAELYLREWITQDQMYAITAQHGMTQANTDLLYDLLGRPIPVHQITKGLARGAVYDGDTTAIPATYLKSLAESNVRPEWFALDFAANEYQWPSYFVLKPLTAAGVITVEECTNVLLWSGWEPTLAGQTAQSFVTTATTASTHVKSAQTQAITKVKQAYVGGAYTNPQAIAALTALDVSATDQPTVLRYWDEITKATAAIGAAEAGTLDTAGLTPE